MARPDPIEGLEVKAWSQTGSRAATVAMLLLILAMLPVAYLLLTGFGRDYAANHPVPTDCSLEAPAPACTPGLELPTAAAVAHSLARWEAEPKLVDLRLDPETAVLVLPALPIDASLRARLAFEDDVKHLFSEAELPQVDDWRPWDEARMRELEASEDPRAARFRALEPQLQATYERLHAEELALRERALSRIYYPAFSEATSARVRAPPVTASRIADLEERIEAMEADPSRVPTASRTVVIEEWTVREALGRLVGKAVESGESDERHELEEGTRAAWLAHELLYRLPLLAGVLAVFLLTVAGLLGWWWRRRPVSVRLTAHRLTIGGRSVPLHDCESVQTAPLGVVLADGSSFGLPRGYRLSPTAERRLTQALHTSLAHARTAEARTEERARLQQLRTHA